MLVANSLNVVLAETVAQQGRTFGRFDRYDAGTEILLQVITGRKGPAGTGGRNVGGRFCACTTFGQHTVELLERRTGATAVDQIISEFAKLIENDIGRVTVKRCTFVVDFLDVTLTAPRAYDLSLIHIYHPFQKDYVHKQ